MPSNAQTDKTVTKPTPVEGALELHRLYYLRFVFAAVWAGLFAATASQLTPVAGTLLVLYPLFDVASAVVDLRSSGTGRARRPLYANVALSLLAAVALAVAAAQGVPDVLRVWGVWAITAGAVQVVLAVRRHRLGGQRVMILSGGISVVAGSTFIAAGAGSDPALTSLAGYAALGGLFFLISGIRLGRAAAQAH
ncbi:MAG: hypothetical protein ACJ72D_23110 [Marmoricola sp.]